MPPGKTAYVFRYRLGGAASNWTETTQRELQFANLAPGAYRLQIDAREGDGEWSREQRGVSLQNSHSVVFDVVVCRSVRIGPFVGCRGSAAAALLSARKKRERELVGWLKKKPPICAAPMRSCRASRLPILSPDWLTGGCLTRPSIGNAPACRRMNLRTVASEYRRRSFQGAE